MNNTYYLVDNNALVALGWARRETKFFRDRCRVSEDVLYEARFASDTTALTALTYKVSPRMLEQVRTVMRTVPPGNTELVDLYKNKGAADPLLVATVLDAVERDDGSLFPDAWVIVTRDKALVSKAKEFGIPTLSPEQLAELIDDGEP